MENFYKYLIYINLTLNILIIGFFSYNLLEIKNVNQDYIIENQQEKLSSTSLNEQQIEKAFTIEDSVQYYIALDKNNEDECQKITNIELKNDCEKNIRYNIITSRTITENNILLCKNLIDNSQILKCEQNYKKYLEVNS